MKPRVVMVVGGLVAAILVAAGGTALHAEDAAAPLAQAQALFKPISRVETADLPTAPAQVALGRMLFFDPRWTVDGNVSCATCHQPALYGTDALPRSIGVRHGTHPRHAPTVLNTGLNFIQHWWGDRRDLEDQAEKALAGVFSSGHSDPGTAAARIEAIEGYAPLFRQAFPGDARPVTPGNVARAISAYERTLLTPAPFDAYLRGDARALSGMATRGLQQFISRGCATCHSGAGVGGGMFQKFGVVEDYWKATGSPEIDKGRSGFTKDLADLYVYKVPSLRNVAMTPPYFHDGSVATLDEAVRVMARVQLGVTLPETEIAEIVAFLGALTGPLPESFSSAPALPPAAVRRAP
jgi:cytochrome c peroxidase